MVYERLIDNSIQAVLASIEIYNKPDFKYREQVFTIINVNAWELLLKAKILHEHGDDIESLYITLPDGRFKTNRSGNVLTIEIIGALRQLALPPMVSANIGKLVEIRDTAVHFYHDDALSYIVYTLAAESLKNYQKLASEWFGVNLLKYNFYILPIGFSYNFHTLSMLDLTAKPDAISKLIQSVTDVQCDSDDEDDFHFVCEIKTQIILPKNCDSVDFTTAIDSSAEECPIFIKTQRLIDKYPLSYKQIWEKIRGEKPYIKQNQLNKFIKDNQIKHDVNFCMFNFRTNQQRQEYLNTRQVPNSIPCLYNQNALRYILENIDNDNNDNSE